MSNLTVRASLAPDLFEALLQNLRNFEMHHLELDLRIVAELPELSVEQVDAIFARIRPPFSYVTTIGTSSGGHLRSRVRG
jgi:hypothetical protein